MSKQKIYMFASIKKFKNPNFRTNMAENKENPKSYQLVDIENKEVNKMIVISLYNYHNFTYLFLN